MRANLTTYYNSADQQRRLHGVALLEGLSPKIMKFGFKGYIVYGSIQGMMNDLGSQQCR